MTKEELAEALHGREYRSEMTNAERAQAKACGLLVLLGASDDLVELYGAIDDELSAYEGTEVLIGHDGKLVTEVDREDEDVLEKYGLLEVARSRASEAHKIRALWCDGKGASWTFDTELPHAKFDIMEEDETFCRGIVIDMRDVVAGCKTDIASETEQPDRQRNETLQRELRLAKEELHRLERRQCDLVSERDEAQDEAGEAKAKIEEIRGIVKEQGEAQWGDILEAVGLKIVPKDGSSLPDIAGFDPIQVLGMLAAKGRKG